MACSEYENWECVKECDNKWTWDSNWETWWRYACADEGESWCGVFVRPYFEKYWVDCADYSNM